MKKKTLILIFFVFVSFNLYSQGWMKIYPDSMDTEIHTVREHYDKGYVFSGERYEGWSYYGFLMKTDVNGEVLWKKSYGLPLKMNQFFSSRVTLDGGLILTGSTNNLSTTCTDPLLIKLNGCGEKEWCKIYNAQGCNSWTKDVDLVDDSGYLMLLDRWKSGQEEMIWLFRLDNLGEVIWAQVYATDPGWNSELSHSILKTTDNCFVITGETYYPDPTYPNKKIIKIILIKVNIDGENIFEVPWGTDNGVYSDGRLSTIDSKNNIYTAGRRARTMEPYGDSPCLFKTSVSGEPVFYRDLKPFSSLGISSTINWFKDSTLALCSQWRDSLSTDTTGVFKTDSLGTLLNQITFSDNYGIYGSSITYNNRLILGGTGYASGNFFGVAIKLTSDLEYDSVYTTPFTYDSLCPHPIVSDTIPLDDCEVVVVGIDDPGQHPEKTKLHVYPNPASQVITVEMPQYLIKTSGGSGITATTYYHQWKSVRLDVFDLFGKLMYSQDIPGKTEKTELDISSWPVGMYIARIVFMNEVTGTVKFVKE